LSFAGQYESFLKVPKENLGDAIKLCWASLFNERSLLSFNVKENPDYLKSGMAVIVQEMIPADYSAIIMSKDPIDKRNLLGIETTYGPCESLVSGKVTGDLILYDRDLKKIVEKEIGSKKNKTIYSIFSKENPQNHKLTQNSKSLSESYAVNEKEINNLVKLGLRIEKIFKHPQDIELVSSNEKVYIVQSREISTG